MTDARSEAEAENARRSRVMAGDHSDDEVDGGSTVDPSDSMATRAGYGPRRWTHPSVG